MARRKFKILFPGGCLIALLFPLAAPAQTTWQVGPSRTYQKPSEVAQLVGGGDVVEIDAGTYQDVASWYADSLTLRGAGGRAHLSAAGLAVEEGKAIWVIKGNNTTVENIEFSGASCPDQNGAGIRQEGAGLTVRSCCFHDNEEGILTGANENSDILIEFTEFRHNGYGDGYSHNIYIGNIRTFTLRYCWSHLASVGHEVKSRAATNYLLYNRISNEEGDASRCLDLPEGGTAFIIGNIIQQGPNAPNSNVFGFGLEGGPGMAYLVNNTFVNNRSSVRFVDLASACAAVLKNNIFYGGSPIVTGEGSYSGDHNYLPEGASGAENLTESLSGGDAGFADETDYDYHLTVASICRNAGVSPGSASGFDLTPVAEYVHPASGRSRPSAGALDLGAFEYPEPGSAAGDRLDYDGDGKSEIAIFRPSNCLWSIRNVTRIYFGAGGDLPAPGDYDGDGTAHPAIFRESTGLWSIRDVSKFYFGNSSDQIVSGDYAGDGATAAALFRSSNALWNIRGLTRVYFGASGDRPAPGYYAGDGKKSIGIFRGGSGLWALRGVTRIYFGGSNDAVVSGDYDGDGIWEPAVFRSSSGLWVIRGVTRTYFGASSDRPVPADFDGDRADEIAIFRDATGLWNVKDLTRAYFGAAGDTPVTR